MKISIIIPLYNKEKTIYSTIDSILKQSFKNFEVIILDDGSEDNSPKIVKSFKDERIKYFKQSNTGAANTRNNACKFSNGDFLLFIDADDTIYVNCLEDLYSLSLKYPNYKVYCGNYSTQINGNKLIACSIYAEGLINNPFKYIWEKKWNIRLGSFLIERNLFFELGGFNSEIVIGEDTYFTNNILNSVEAVYTPKRLMVYNNDNSSLSNKKTPFLNHIENYFNLSNKNFYQNMIEAETLFKHIFRGLIRKDPAFTYNLTKKFYNKTHLMVLSVLLRIWTLLSIKK